MATVSAPCPDRRAAAPLLPPSPAKGAGAVDAASTAMDKGRAVSDARGTTVVDSSGGASVATGCERTTQEEPRLVERVARRTGAGSRSLPAESDGRDSGVIVDGLDEPCMLPRIGPAT